MPHCVIAFSRIYLISGILRVETYKGAAAAVLLASMHRELRRHAADGHADLRRTTRPIGTTRRIHVRGVNPAVSPHNARTSAGA